MEVAHLTRTVFYPSPLGVDVGARRVQDSGSGPIYHEKEPRVSFLLWSAVQVVQIWFRSYLNVDFAFDPETKHVGFGPSKL